MSTRTRARTKRARGTRAVPPRPPIEDGIPVGERISMLRQRERLTVSALARKARISKGHVSALEHGIERNPTLGVLTRIADALGITVVDLLGGPRVGTRQAPSPEVPPVPETPRSALAEFLGAPAPRRGAPVNEEILWELARLLLALARRPRSECQ